MKALIFPPNADMLMDTCGPNAEKAMARLSSGETLFGRQLRLLALAGLTEVVVMSGPHVAQLRSVASRFPNLTVSFVSDDIYDEASNVSSTHLAQNLLDDDILMLGDNLVFNRAILDAVLSDPRPNLVVTNANLPPSDNGIGARFTSDLSESIHEDDCGSLRPLYKLDRRAVGVWLDRVTESSSIKNTGTSAKSSFNEMLREVGVQAFSCADHFIEEIGSPEDLMVHTATLRMWDFDEQLILAEPDACNHVPDLLKQLRLHKPLLVGRSGFRGSKIQDLLDAHCINYSLFTDYSSDLQLTEVLAGLTQYQSEGCDSILSVGGGSAINAAKCITLLASTGRNELPSFGDPILHTVPHICVPTTAGTGSESTNVAIVHADRIKRLIEHDSLLPHAAVLDPELLRTLPTYHKKSGILNALVQCIESMWSLETTARSRAYAYQGIEIFLRNFFPYFRKDVDFDLDVTLQMQIASNFSGKATNLAKTSSAYTLSDSLVSQFGIARGHAAALCLPGIWRVYGLLFEEDDADEGHLREAMAYLNDAFGVETTIQALRKFDAIMATLQLPGAISMGSHINNPDTEQIADGLPSIPADVIERIYENALGIRPVTTLKPLKNGVPGYGEKITQNQVPALQSLELEIFEEFDSFCSKHGLTYYLSEGSLLGAIRHGGFIPWDDDLDVMMPRADYDRFCDLVAAGELSENLNLDSFQTNPTHWTIGAKLQMTSPTRFVQQSVAHVSQYPRPYIDIFMIDGVKKVAGKKFDLQAYALRGLRRALFMSSGRSRNLHINPKVRLPIYMGAKIVGSRVLQSWIVYFQTRFNGGVKSTHLANLCSYYDLRNQVFPQEWFGTGRRVPFEGITAVVPDRAEDMLAKIYGDTYVSIPTLGPGHRKHNFYIQYAQES